MKNYFSITYGELTEKEVFNLLKQKIENSEENYRLYVGTDSQFHKGQIKVATVIVLHKERSGGIFFSTISHEPKFHTLRQRMYHEAIQSIELSKRLLDFLYEENLDFGITIDIDIGPNDKTKEMINELVGYVLAEGFEVRIKPESAAASTVADKMSK